MRHLIEDIIGAASLFLIPIGVIALGSALGF